MIIKKLSTIDEEGNNKEANNGGIFQYLYDIAIDIVDRLFFSTEMEAVEVVEALVTVVVVNEEAAVPADGSNRMRVFIDGMEIEPGVDYCSFACQTYNEWLKNEEIMGKPHSWWPDFSEY